MQQQVGIYEALDLIAGYLAIESDGLKMESELDLLGGYHADESKRNFPTGSIWGVEGRILYALVRILRPRRVLEIGTFFGCSTLHIANALQENVDEYGDNVEFVTVDNGFANGQPPHWDFDFIRSVKMDAIEFLETEQWEFDMMFEDGKHDAEFVGAIYTAAKRNAVPDAVLISHDAAHFLVGGQVIDGIRSAGLQPLVVLPEPSDCGLSVVRIKKPYESESIGRYAEEISQAISQDDIETEQLSSFDDPQEMTKSELLDELEAAGIDPNSITGSGSGGALLKADLVAAVIEARQ